MPILLTAGATREPIDAVRFISNLSTGSTGAALADALTALGHHVVVLRGLESAKPTRAAEQELFSSAADLGQRLQHRLASGIYDAVIMTAAVADYRPEAIRSDKMSSQAPELTLRLLRNPKLLPQLKAWSPRPLTVIGFKLTVAADPAARLAAVRAQHDAGGVDATVLNDLVEIRTATIHPFHLYRGGSGAATGLAAPTTLAGVPALAAALHELLPPIKPP